MAETTSEIKAEAQVIEVSPPAPIVAQSAPQSVTAGSHEDWMAQAGISPSDYQYVEYIINKESTWNPNAVNPNGGACGLVQALPCSKLGPNWNDPIMALKWGNSYATSRYGSWYGAYQFWLSHRWW